MPAQYAIIPGDATAHRSEVLALYESLPAASLRRLEKYYERNPLGPPIFVLAKDTESQRCVGLAALLPARLWIDDELMPPAIEPPARS